MTVRSYIPCMIMINFCIPINFIIITSIDVMISIHGGVLLVLELLSYIDFQLIYVHTLHKIMFTDWLVSGLCIGVTVRFGDSEYTFREDAGLVYDVCLMFSGPLKMDSYVELSITLIPADGADGKRLFYMYILC